MLHMNEETFATIRTARTPAEAELLMSALRSEGLHPLELNMAGHFSFAGADISYPIRVPSAEAAQAKDILQGLATTQSNSQEAL